MVIGTIPLISFQPAFAPVPVEGSDMSGGVGLALQYVGLQTPPSYVQPNIPPEGETCTVPSAPPSETREECKQPNMPFHVPSKPFHPEIRMYKPLDTVCILSDYVNNNGAYIQNLFFAIFICHLCSNVNWGNQQHDTIIT